MHRNCNYAGYGPAFERRGFGRGFGSGFRRPKYNVPLNIEENEDHYLVSVYATGFSKEQIKISITDDVLYISGTKEVEENYKPNFSKQEFPVKSFERMISLEGQVNIDGISANQVEGVLYVKLPKTDAAKQPDREIKVD